MEARTDRPYLAVDTSSALGSVAVGRGDRLLAEVVVGVSTRHSEALLPAVDFALGSAGLEPAELAGVVVAAGPGSFTGVRIAAASAKAMVRVLDIPFFAYSSLAALAATAASERPVCAMFDARRGEVYAGCYRFAGGGAIETVLADEASPVEEVVRRLGPLDPIYLGEGAVRYRAEIEALGGRVAPRHVGLPRAAALLWLADTVPEAGRVADPAEWEPEYVRSAGVEREARR